MTVAPNIATMKRMPNGLKNLHFLILLLFYVFTYADNRTGKIFYGAGKKNGRNFLRAVFVKPSLRPDESVVKRLRQVFADWQGLPALQAGASPETFSYTCDAEYSLRRAEQIFSIYSER
jgi:hypothetical protein